MVCLPCLAIPAIALSGGTAATANSNKVFIWSLVLTLIFTVVFVYYKYYKPCATCIV